MKKYIVFFTIIIVFGLIIFPVFAQEQKIDCKDPSGGTAIQCGLNTTSNTAGLSTIKSPRDMVETIVGYVLAFIGVIIFINIILAGYQWITAGGNEDAITKSKDKIKNSIIGLVIILAAYAITSTVFTLLKDVVVQ